MHVRITLYTYRHDRARFTSITCELNPISKPFPHISRNIGKRKEKRQNFRGTTTRIFPFIQANDDHQPPNSSSRFFLVWKKASLERPHYYQRTIYETHKYSPGGDKTMRGVSLITRECLFLGAG